MTIMESTAKSMEARVGFIQALARHGRLIEREAIDAIWEDHRGWAGSPLQSRTRLRRFDLIVGPGREGWQSLSLTGRGGCSPVLSISMPDGFGGDATSDPSGRAVRMIDLARRLSSLDASVVEDEAVGLARVASMVIQPAEASVEVIRPSPWTPASIRMTTISQNGNFRLFPGKRNPTSHREIRDRLDRMLIIALPRISEAISCVWGANKGGGHSLHVGPSTAQGIWRASEHNAVDNLRLSADWVREIEGSIEP